MQPSLSGWIASFIPKGGIKEIKKLRKVRMVNIPSVIAAGGGEFGDNFNDKKYVWPLRRINFISPHPHPSEVVLFRCGIHVFVIRLFRFWQKCCKFLAEFL
jgi:hypothetical protein